MKKITVVLLAATFAISFAACSSQQSAETTEKQTQTQIIEETDTVTENSTEPESETQAESQTESDDKTEESAENMSKEEIVALYNESANKIKTQAKVITRNYMRMKNIPDMLELPPAISSLGQWAIETFVKGSEESAVFDEKSEITEYFPVSNENYTSRLTPEMVKSATIEETDSFYKITIVLYDDAITSPKKGQGYAGVFNTVTASTFEGINVPGTTFEKVEVHGLNGKIDCTMDKETKQITALTLWNTDYLDLGVKVGVSKLKVKMAFSNENDYTIKY